jgi:hypothetical protein
MESIPDDFMPVCANASDSNVSELWLVKDRVSGIVTATFLLLFLVVGLPWNLLVIATIVKQRLYTQPTIILLLSLASTDLVLLVFHVPQAMIVGFHGEYLFGNSDRVRCSVCSKTGFIPVLFGLNSTFQITLMSIDRFLFIYKPLKYDRYVTVWRTVIAIALSWIVAVVLSILPLTGFGNISYVTIQCDIEVNPGNDMYGILVLTVFCLAVIPVLVSNMWVCCIVQRNIRAIYKVRRSQKTCEQTPDEITFYQSLRKKRHERELHVVKVFGALLCSNTISWLPIIVLTLIQFTGMAVPDSAIDAVQVFFLSQAAVHPIIETTLIKEVRQPLKAILFCPCAARLDTSQVHTTETKECPESSHETGCGGDFMDICGSAVLLNHFTHSNSAAAHEQNRTRKILAQ